MLTFMSRINFVLSLVEHGKSSITSGPGVHCLSRSLGHLCEQLRALIIYFSLLLQNKFSNEFSVIYFLLPVQYK